MKALAWALGAVLVAGLLIAEAAMDLTSRDRTQLYSIFGLVAALGFGGATIALRVGGRLRSLRLGLQVVAGTAVAIASLAVGLSAWTMFIEPHDLHFLLVALVLGLGLGGVVAMAVANPLTADLAQVTEAASKVEQGDLSARTEVARSDELGDVARAFDSMASRLQASEEERRSLLESISHDLRTPLASMQAAVEALQDGLAPDPPGYLRGLSLDLEHLRLLIDDLFLLARLESGNYQLQVTEVDLAELADEAVEAATPVAARRQVHLGVASPGRLGLHADPGALGRVFRNLLANAVRHSPEGGQVRIELSASRTEVSALVADQGAGFSADMRKRAFERFARADNSRNRDSGGSGLGLSIAKGLVEAHGGAIEIVEGAGGQVRFTLPVS